MTPTNQPTESKGEPCSIRPSTGKFANLCGVVWCEPEPGSEMKIAVFSNEHVGEDEAIDNAELCADAFETYTRTGLTPRQLAERVKELEEMEGAFSDALANIKTDADSDATGSLEERLNVVVAAALNGWDVQKEEIRELRDQLAASEAQFKAAAEWNKLTELEIGNLRSLKDDLETDLAASEAAREELMACLSEARIVLLSPLNGMGFPERAARQVVQAIIDLSAQQPAEALEKREDERPKFALDETVRLIMGQPNFVLAPIAHRMQAMGHDIKRKAEDEQAYVMHWLLHLYFEHGEDWKQKAEEYLKSGQAIDHATGRKEEA